MAHEARHLGPSQYESDEDFWRKKFSTLPPEANLLSTQVDAQSEKETTGTIHKILQLTPEQMGPIKDKVKYIGLQPFDFFLSSLLIVLQRFFGREEVVVAIPIAKETEITPKLEYVLFRHDVKVDETFQAYTILTSKSWKECILHSVYPFSKVADQIRAMHGAEIGYFCMVEFDYLEGKPGNSQSGRTTFDDRKRMPLRLQIGEGRKTGGKSVHLEVTGGFVLDDIAERLLISYVNLCNEGNIGRLIRDIDYLADEEKNLLYKFGFTKDVETTSKLIHSAFEESALRSPLETAVIFDNLSLSYGKVNEMASLVAYHISKVIDLPGIQTKPIVLFMSKDHLAVVCILAVWKVGGYFLPMSTTHSSTLKDVIQSKSSPLLLHNFDLPDDIRDLILTEKTKVLDVRTLFNVKDTQNEIMNRNFTSVARDSDTAYAIRTSGSTGDPKTCKISHRSLEILSQAWVEACGLFPGARIIQWAPLSFDVYIGELVRAFISTQGTLIICPDNRRLDVGYIRMLFEQFRVTHAEFTPQFALRVVETAPQSALASLKCLVIGSDATHITLFKSIKSKLRPDQRFIHGYGMTEATIDSVYYESDLIPQTRSGTVPIGKPLAGVGAIILDTFTKLPCPIGTKGELYLFGETIAGGDVHKKNIIFFSSSFTALPTKDQCCWLPSGDIEIYNRLDDVVKIRGFRVSLAEVENKIRDFVDGVQEICVLQEEAKEEGKVFLVAFIVVKEDYKEIINKTRVSLQLRGNVPYYLIPDLVTCIPVLPLTVNGKVDRRALPSLNEILNKQFSAAENHESEMSSVCEGNHCSLLQNLFAEALGLGKNVNLSLTETFMNQGGNSLVLVAFHNLIKERTPFDINIETIFNHPTILSLDAYIRNHSAEEQT